MPAFPPRAMMLQVVQPGQHHGRALDGDFGWPITYNDDVAQLWWGTGPQLDGLGHLGENGEFYNCTPGSEFAAITGLEKFGIHQIPPLVGRGVLVDMAEHFGVDTLDAGQAISSADLIAAADAQDIEFETGDIILIHTGWTDAMLEDDPDTWVASEPGITNEAAEYLASLNPIAVGSDTWGVEAVPPPEGGPRLLWTRRISQTQRHLYSRNDEYRSTCRRGCHGVSLCARSGSYEGSRADDDQSGRDVVSNRFCALRRSAQNTALSQYARLKVAFV